jgi:hypothetical protein
MKLLKKSFLMMVLLRSLVKGRRGVLSQNDTGLRDVKYSGSKELYVECLSLTHESVHGPEFLYLSHNRR